MMTKWDTIQADLEPITPYSWNVEDEDYNTDLSLDELLEMEETELEEMENE